MKNGSVSSQCLWTMAVLLCSGMGALSGRAAETDEAKTPEYTAHTTLNPDIPLDQLKVMVKPLTKSELQVESDAWFKLLRAKAREIAAVRMGVKKATEAVNAADDEAAKSSLEVAESITKTVADEAEQEEKSVTAMAQRNLGLDEDVMDNSSPAEEPAPETDDTEPAGDTESAGDAEPAGAAEPAGDLQSPDNDGGSTTETASPTAGESDAQTKTVNTAIKLKGDMLTSVTKLQDQRTVLSDRLAVVLNSLEAKGGDVAEYRTYSAAVSGIELDTSDAASAWAGIVGWMSSKEGGQRLAWNLGRFALILFITYLIAKVVAAIVNWLLERKLKLSQLAERLIASMIKNIVMLVGFAIALTALEVDITPVLAAIGATGLVIGLALQGTLSNFASGLMILINRPFDVGNVVNAGGITGTIAQMNLVSTTFRTFDNQTIHVPNNEIWNNVITNITANPTRRVDLEFGIGYDDDFEQAENLIKDVLQANKLVLSDPEPVVVTHELADSSVNIVCRPWAKTSDWWQVKTEVTREVKRKFDQVGISFPYPQQDVHFYGAAPAQNENA